MRSSYISILILSLLAMLLGFISGCGSSATNSVVIPEAVEPFAELEFGTAETFDLVTWNLKEFPWNGSKTVTYLTAAAQKLDVDVIAMQEIGSAQHLASVAANLGTWDSWKANSAFSDIDLAYLWNTETVKVTAEIYEIFTHDSYAFPRPPLVMECEWQGVPLVIIDNHLKARGSAEDVLRRKLACIALDQYIENNLPDVRVIVVGDMNDNLADAPSENVFQVFLDDSANYRFGDMSIAQGSSANWSWKMASHLDHILITNELFSEFSGASTVVMTLRMDQYLEKGFSEYEANLSDHLPVGLKIDLTP